MPGLRVNHLSYLSSMDPQNLPEDDVDVFLYGPSEDTKSAASNPSDLNSATSLQPDDDDDDDDVEIVLSAGSNTAPSNPNILSDAGGFLKMSAKQNQDGSSNAPNSANGSGSQNGQAGRIGGVDLSSIATLDGQSLLDVEIEGFEEKPWRKPGADITDYFNFGFNELTWKQYCYKQKNLREEFSKASGSIFASAAAPLTNSAAASNVHNHPAAPSASTAGRPRDKMYSSGTGSRRYSSRSRSPSSSGKRMRPDDDRDRRRGGRY